MASKLSGKQSIIQQLRDEADELRGWLFSHTSPDTRASEFDKYANRYAIVCTRIYIIEKQW